MKYEKKEKTLEFSRVFYILILKKNLYILKKCKL